QCIHKLTGNQHHRVSILSDLKGAEFAINSSRLQQLGTAPDGVAAEPFFELVDGLAYFLLGMGRVCKERQLFWIGTVAMQIAGSDADEPDFFCEWELRKEFARNSSNLLARLHEFIERVLLGMR